MSNVLNEYKILLKVKSTRGLRGEDAIANQVAMYLKALTLSEELKAVWFHVPNESVVTNRSDIIRLGRKHALGMVNGAPDFIITNGDKTLFIELKTEKGRQTESQKLFEKWCCKHKISYGICRSIPEVDEILKKNGLLRFR